MNYTKKRFSEKTPEERYNESLFDLCDTQLFLLKHRVGQLEEIPLEERAGFQDFCDTARIIFHTFLMGAPDPAELEGLKSKITMKGAADDGKQGRPAKRA